MTKISMTQTFPLYVGVPYVWILRFLMFEFFEHSDFAFVSDFDIRISYLLFLITA
jgi:hypothetical protein